MKKFISMVMAAAMVVSLVPATAFAANSATFKVAGDYELTEEAADLVEDDTTATIDGTEVQLKLTDVDNATATGDTWKITLSFENAEVGVDVAKDAEIENFVTVKNTEGTVATLKATATQEIDKEDDSVAITLEETEGMLAEDDVIVLDLDALKLYMTDAADVTVEVSGKFGESDPMVLVAVLEEGIDVTLKKVGEVAEEEEKELKSDLIIEPSVGEFAVGQKIEVKLNSGFEWSKIPANVDGDGVTFSADEDDDDTFWITIDNSIAAKEIVIDKDSVKIDAVDAKAGDVATITVKAKDNVAKAFKATATVDAMEVVGETVTLSVEEDEDVPVFYSGVKADNDYLNDDEDHMSLEVTIEESVMGALDVKKDIELMLTEGVFVTDVKVVKKDGVKVAGDDFEALFKNAYKEGEQEGFVFDRKTFTATDDDSVNKAMEFTFQFELIAVPGFVGDVELTLDGAGFDEAQTVTIATFVAPYTVEAAQNDLIIDYRNTEVPTEVVVKEAEAGLWNDGKMNFVFSVDYMDFEDDATITVDEDSEMEVKEIGEMGFIVDEESEDEAAVVTISDIALYMSRNLAAGAYDLELSTSAGYEMMTTPLYTAEDEGELGAGKYCVADIADWDVDADGDFIGEAGVAKEAFINIITAGRDQDDASFTKKVVVYVGETTMIAGEETVALDVPAYINAAGYTMLPVRAVATALGINNNNVIWSQTAKQVTILYGQRIITMTAGQSVVYVNGSAIPAAAAVEIVDGRAFLALRDLANALGVTTIAWDPATQTATLN